MKSSTTLLAIICLTAFVACSQSRTIKVSGKSHWLLVDDFESGDGASRWVHFDADNQTDPYVPDPQISVLRFEESEDNHYLIKKPAEDGIVGNRKALSSVPLPQAIDIGALATIYTRVNVEYFPNNHSFGLSNLTAAGIAEQHYDAFEPMIRITDKLESNGYKNDGTLMVMVDNKAYAKISKLNTREPAQPLKPDTWYELWYVVNNAPKAVGGQSYDLYIRGGEFEAQQLVYKDARFRMQREQSLTHFVAICNTGPKDKPYGNGGVRYDDIYMASGTLLTKPINGD